MDQTIIVGILSLLGTLIGTLGGILTANKLTTYRIEQLEKKVEAHNKVIDRVYKLETDKEVFREELKGLITESMTLNVIINEVIKMNEKMKNWLRAAGVRAIKTVAQTAVSMLSGNMLGIVDVDWLSVLSVSAMAGVVSLLTSVAGLPELKAE